jgi:hypothetical protein
MTILMFQPLSASVVKSTSLRSTTKSGRWPTRQRPQLFQATLIPTTGLQSAKFLCPRLTAITGCWFWIAMRPGSQLRVLPQTMDVIVGLQGRHTANWDEAMRPIPANARIVRLADIRCGRKNHQTAKSAGLSGRCVTAHPPAPLPVYFKTDCSKH